jgi:DNA uptake protein ComE-like DNA-binding protein
MENCPMKTAATETVWFAIALLLVAETAGAQAPRVDAKAGSAPILAPTPVKPIKPVPKIELNTATAAQLQDTLGLGPLMAKQVIANRPYASIDDLKKVGLSPSMIAKIQPLVLIAGKPAASKASPAGPPIAGKSARPPQPTKKLDLNSARFSEIQDLPGIGLQWAPRVLAGRPYGNADDLLRIGIPSSAVEKIRPLVYFGPEPPRGE